MAQKQVCEWRCDNCGSTKQGTPRNLPHGWRLMKLTSGPKPIIGGDLCTDCVHAVITTLQVLQVLAQERQKKEANRG